ncbi:unnamed protein product [Notodromas monacha]|uniref:Uncharacterized protein n=1 Tax=Notodromas monacha TaxID=399045 RepID=A0A7R9BGH7_9CRUS|nr:unnamed protein product [Notodromas monacha]CAG0914184.1 unnamed protein product [Notodromas monacha]
MDDDVEMTGFKKTLHFIAEEELGPPGKNDAAVDDNSVAESSEELFTGEKGMLVREICYLDREAQALKEQLSDLDDMLLALKAGFRYKNGYLDVPADVWHQVFDAYADPDPKTKAYKQKEVELKQELDSLTAELAGLQEESIKLYNNYKRASVMDPKRALLAAGGEKSNAILKETREVLGAIKDVDARLRTTHQKTNEVILAWDGGYALQSVINELARFLDRAMEFLKRFNEDIEQFLGEHSMPLVHNKDTLKEFFIDPSLEEMY